MVANIYPLEAFGLIGIITIWKNSAVKPFGREVFFVVCFLVTVLIFKIDIRIFRFSILVSVLAHCVLKEFVYFT